MNLILQGLHTERAAIDGIIALAQPRHVNDIGAYAWRCEGVAYSAALQQQVDLACLAQQVDYAFMDAARKLADFKLVAMDMDSTLITIECIDEIADMHGIKPQVAQITEAAMRGEIAFRDSLMRRVALLKGLDSSALQRVYDERLKLSLGAEKMLQAVQAAGLKTLLVSGGFSFFTERMQQRLHLDYCHANTLEIVDGKLTGKILGELVDAPAKRRTVERVCAELGVATTQAIVMGDGANDLEMMGISGLSVAFRAKPVVRAQADAALNFVGLDGMLNIVAHS